MKFVQIELTELLSVEKYLLKRMRSNGLDCWSEEHKELVKLMRSIAK